MAQLPTFSEAETLVGIAGDWHGTTKWATYALSRLERQGVRTVLQLGDFGVWPGESGQGYLDDLQSVLDENDQTIYVTLGNHEDYTQIHTIEPDELGLKWIRPSIVLFPRPFRFEMKMTTFLSLGGAPSVDRDHRVAYQSWWPEEMLTEEEVAEAVAGGTVDVMLTHDAPNGGTHAVSNIISHGGGWSRDSLLYAAEGRMLMDKAVYGVRPQMLLHGHYHVKDSGYLRYDRLGFGEIHSLAPDGVDGNIGVLHLDEDFIFEWIEA